MKTPHTLLLVVAAAALLAAPARARPLSEAAAAAAAAPPARTLLFASGDRACLEVTDTSNSSLAWLARVVQERKVKSPTYTNQEDDRWSGIDSWVCPPTSWDNGQPITLPEYADCSSFVTWLYWTFFGMGEDYLNGEDWAAGNTATQVAHGKQVACDPSTLQPGDLVFYGWSSADLGKPPHVAMWGEHGQVVSMGGSGLGLYSYDFDFTVGYKVIQCRRYSAFWE